MSGLALRFSDLPFVPAFAEICDSNLPGPHVLLPLLTHLLQDENDDSCYTCGGNGELVCCDGCTYSFHFLCVDPPMTAGSSTGEWYCNECIQRQYPPIGERKGAFSDLDAVLEGKNPRAFRLPVDVREHFEGVRTGPEGEYEDSAPVAKPK